MTPEQKLRMIHAALDSAESLERSVPLTASEAPVRRLAIATIDIARVLMEIVEETDDRPVPANTKPSQPLWNTWTVGQLIDELKRYDRQRGGAL